MSTSGFTLFETAIGSCGIAWGYRGIASLRLPDESEAAMRGWLAQRYPAEREAPPPAGVARVCEAVAESLAGNAADLSWIRLDMDGIHPFERAVYDVTRLIPFGSTLTYGEVAKRIGDPQAAQAVGRALGRNPFAPVVPCHRVLAADGTLRGFSAPGGIATKRRMLRIEGALPEEPPSLFDAMGLPGFSA